MTDNQLERVALLLGESSKVEELRQGNEGLKSPDFAASIKAMLGARSQSPHPILVRDRDSGSANIENHLRSLHALSRELSAVSSACAEEYKRQTALMEGLFHLSDKLVTL